MEISSEAAESLRWRGTTRLINVVGPPKGHERFVTAVKDYAAMLGLDVSCDGTGYHWIMNTGTPGTWLAADKLAAYMDGLADALSNNYGTSPSPRPQR